MPAEARSSYDEIPYEGFALSLTHPNHLAALARLFEASPPEVETCRVLELGCARGDNLIPMALSLPRARFVGIDLSPRQIAEGQDTIAKLGLENIELRAGSILDLGPDLGTFDFLVAHGIYSWVPEPVREKIFQLCATALVPNGLAHISYNTYPGWHMGAMVRDMMLFQARQTTGIRARVHAGRTLMQGLAQVLARYDNPYAQCLRDEAERIVRCDESYLAHEFLDETNHPVYLHQFVDRAAAHGLRYFTDAEYWRTAAAQPAELFQALGDSGLDWLAREQLYDFVNGRSFRHAVLCHEGSPCSRTPSLQALQSLRFTPRVRPAAEGATAGSERGEAFLNFRGEVAFSTSDAVLRASLHTLWEAWPRSLSFEALRTRAQERVAATVPGGEAGADAGPGPFAAALVEALLSAFARNHIELHVREPGFTTEPGTRPMASPVARHQAATRPKVANLRHQMVTLMDFDQLVLPHLDGQHDRAALLAEMQRAVQNGVFSIRSQGRPITDPEEAAPILARLLEESLRRLAAGALLMD
jgi:methyltransferase-like protein/trans-aconitate methyltransferase